MSLRLKLLLLGLATLVLPWGGCNYAREMELALREGEQNSLQAVSQTMAASLQGRTDLLYRETDDSAGARCRRPMIRPALRAGLGPIYSRRMRAALPRRTRAALTTIAAIACAAVVAGCGSQGIQLAKSNPYYHGAALFRDHCSGCHTLAVVGAEGSATSIKDRLKTNGPNFNIRKENVEQVLYAIRNGGFSGAIMPENIVLGDDAREVAAFLAHYSGSQSQSVPSTNITLSTK